MIERIDDGNHRGRTAPDRANDAKRQEAGFTAAGDLFQLLLEQLHELLRGDGAKRLQQFRDGVFDRKVADERDNEEQRREQRQKKVERELCGEAEAMIVANLANRVRRDIAPRTPRAEVCEELHVTDRHIAVDIETILPAIDIAARPTFDAYHLSPYRRRCTGAYRFRFCFDIP